MWTFMEWCKHSFNVLMGTNASQLNISKLIKVCQFNGFDWLMALRPV